MNYQDTIIFTVLAATAIIVAIILWVVIHHAQIVRSEKRYIRILQGYMCNQQPQQSTKMDMASGGESGDKPGLTPPTPSSGSVPTPPEKKPSMIMVLRKTVTTRIEIIIASFGAMKNRVSSRLHRPKKTTRTRKKSKRSKKSGSSWIWSWIWRAIDGYIKKHQGWLRRRRLLKAVRRGIERRKKKTPHPSTVKSSWVWSTLIPLLIGISLLGTLVATLGIWLLAILVGVGLAIIALAIGLGFYLKATSGKKGAAGDLLVKAKNLAKQKTSLIVLGCIILLTVGIFLFWDKIHSANNATLIGSAILLVMIIVIWKTADRWTLKGIGWTIVVIAILFFFVGRPVYYRLTGAPQVAQAAGVERPIESTWENSKVINLELQAGKWSPWVETSWMPHARFQVTTGVEFAAQVNNDPRERRSKNGVLWNHDYVGRMRVKLDKDGLFVILRKS